MSLKLLEKKICPTWLLDLPSRTQPCPTWGWHLTPCLQNQPKPWIANKWIFTTREFIIFYSFRIFQKARCMTNDKDGGRLWRFKQMVEIVRTAMLRFLPQSQLLKLLWLGQQWLWQWCDGAHSDWLFDTHHITHHITQTYTSLCGKYTNLSSYGEDRLSFESLKSESS